MEPTNIPVPTAGISLKPDYDPCFTTISLLEIIIKNDQECFNRATDMVM